MRRALAISILVTTVAAPVRFAFGDEESTALMRQRFDRGQDYYTARKFEAAAAEFRAAYEIEPAAALLYNEAVCYEKLRRCDDAVRLFKRYLDEARSPRDRHAVEGRIKACGTGEPPEPPGMVVIETDPSGAKLYLDDMNTYLGESPWSGNIDGAHKLLVVAKGMTDVSREIVGTRRATNHIITMARTRDIVGWTEISANVPGSDVYIDDKARGPWGRTPWAGHLLPGRHTITVSREGFTEDVQEVEVVAGEARTVKARIEALPVGFVHISGMTIEGARVSIDGKTVCEAAPCRFQSPSGTHRLTVEKKGQKPYTRLLGVGTATETELSVRLEKKRPRTDLIWKFGFAGAFLTGGVVLGLHARSINQALEGEIDAGNPPLPADDRRFTKGKIYAIAADGLFVVGAISATYAVLSLFSEPGPASAGHVTDTRDLMTASAPFRRAPIRVVPAVGPSYAGVAAEIRW
jgi:hypothetical protein